MVYRWTCNSCKFWSMEMSGSLPKRCPECEARNWTAKQYKQEDGFDRHYIDAMHMGVGRWSDSMGCTAADIDRMRKLHPGSEWRQRPSGGYQMFLKDRHDKLKRMKEAGFRELE